MTVGSMPVSYIVLSGTNRNFALRPSQTLTLLKLSGLLYAGNPYSGITLLVFRIARLRRPLIRSPLYLDKTNLIRITKVNRSLVS
jgi:hypothetical protein